MKELGAESDDDLSLNVKQKYLKLRDRFFVAANNESHVLQSSLLSTEKKAKKLQEENSHLLDLIIRLNPEAVTDYSSDSTTSSDQEELEEQQRRAAEEEKEALQNEIEESNLQQKRKLSPDSAAQFDGQNGEDALYGDDEIDSGRGNTKKAKRIPRPKTGKKMEEPISFDADGNPILPAELGKGSVRVTLVSLGQTQPGRETFASTRYIFPVGYTSHKIYASLADTKRKAVYQNEIVDGGDAPLFKVTFLEDPTRTFTHVSSSGVWKKILDELTAMGYSAKTHASGPDFFGLSNATIQELIRRLPGAEQCFAEVATRKSGQTEKQVSARNRRGTSSAGGTGAARTTKGGTTASVPATTIAPPNELEPMPMGMIAVPSEALLSHEFSQQQFQHHPNSDLPIYSNNPAVPVYYDHMSANCPSNAPGSHPSLAQLHQEEYDHRITTSSGVPGVHPLGQSLAQLQHEEYEGALSDDENEEYSAAPFSFQNPAASMPVYAANTAYGSSNAQPSSFMNSPPMMMNPLHPSSTGYPIPGMPRNLSMMDSGDGFLRVGNDWSGRDDGHQGDGNGR